MGIKALCTKEDDGACLGLDQNQRLQPPTTEGEVYKLGVKEGEDSIPALDLEIGIDSDRFVTGGTSFGEEDFKCVEKEIEDIQKLNVEFQNQFQDEGSTKIESLQFYNEKLLNFILFSDETFLTLVS